MRIAIICAALALAGTAKSHDKWADGSPVPSWVRAACCGPEDVHHLRPDQVHLMADGYHIDGLDVVVPEARALPSQDGDFWGFWSPYSGPHPLIYCLFVPFKGA